MRCRRTVRPAYNNIRRGLGGCAYCAGKAVDIAVAGDMMLAAGLEPLEPYPGAAKPWACRCLKCGQVVNPRYADIDSGQGGCRTCTRYGFDLHGPAVVYLLAHDEFAAVKIGITGTNSDRLKHHGRHGWRVVRCWPIQNGAAALAVEQQVLRWWRGDLGAPVAVPTLLMPQRGASETASADLVDLEATMQFVEERLADQDAAPPRKDHPRRR